MFLFFNYLCIIVMEEKRVCPICGDAVTGRIDKKFCSDQCRTEYNNRYHKESNNYIRQVNNILRRNRKILEDLNPNGKVRVGLNKLAEKGFNFQYFTNIYKTKSGNTYYFCYEQGYLQLPEGDYALVTRDK